MKVVYVLGVDGKPLMPTKRFGKVRRMLKNGKAKAVKTKPFTIQLLYETKTKVTSTVIGGMDPGRTNIGTSSVNERASNLFSAHCITRNKDIPDLIADKKKERHNSRYGERQRRKRRAKKNGTLMDAPLQRILPGCKEPVLVKDIINTEARFNNRYRPEGWVTPTANQLLETCLNLVREMCSILPVSAFVLEINKFGFMQLANPNMILHAVDYQGGPLKGFKDSHEATCCMQDGKCLLCGKPQIDHYHHIVPRSKGGSDTVENLAGLCKDCHRDVHTKPEAYEKMKEEKQGQIKKFGGTSILNQIMPALVRELTKMFGDNFYVTPGWSTKEFRDKHGIRKDHDVDAYCIACSALDINEDTVLDPPGSEESYEIMQFRRHDRARIYAQTERSYYYKGKKVAKNRHPRFEQDKKYPALDQWYEKMVAERGERAAQKMRSQLTVKKSKRRYNNKDRHLPGTPFRYDGETYIMKGQQNGGDYIYAYDGPDGKTKRFPTKKCEFFYARGFAYV